MSIVICLQDLISDFNIEKQIFKYLAGGGEGGLGKGNLLTRPDIQYFDKTNCMSGTLYEKRVGEGVGYKKHMDKT